MPGRLHQFAAVAFEENLSLRDLARAIPLGRLGARDFSWTVSGGGEVFVYAFGAVVFCDVPAERRDQELALVHRARPGLTTKVVRETFTVREEEGGRTGLVDGVLVLDQLNSARAAVIALIVGQSAAMEYYEAIVEGLFARTAQLVEPLEKHGTVPLRTRQLHRFIGQAIATRNEVLSVLFLLDKPDATWDDPRMDRIYGDLRGEFDLVDRHQALESKLGGVQSALELILDVARDRRMFLLEVAIVALIVLELLLSWVRR